MSGVEWTRKGRGFWETPDGWSVGYNDGIGWQAFDPKGRQVGHPRPDSLSARRVAEAAMKEA